jgi:DNA-binding TFAR19-related protein (PDSD5 family)
MSDDELDQIRKRKLLSMQNRRMSDEQRQAQAENRWNSKTGVAPKILAPVLGKGQ